MIVYHGSYIEVNKPDVTMSRANVDFGKGFYMTPLYEQAVKWAHRFKLKRGCSVISKYEVDDELLRSQYSIKEFTSYSDEWLDFIVACRSGKSVERYDVVIGGGANDKVFDTIELYFDGLIEKAVAIERLRYEKPNLQICFCSQKAIDQCIRFIESEVL